VAALALLSSKRGAPFSSWSKNHRRRSWKPLSAAAQLVASNCAGITRYVSSPGALALFRDRDGSNPVTTVQAIAHHLALDISDADVVEIVENLTAAGLSFDKPGGAERWGEIQAKEKRVVDGAVGPYITYLTSGNLPPITWERELFFLGDRPRERALGVIDVTGTSAPSIGWTLDNAATGIVGAVIEPAFFRERLPSMIFYWKWSSIGRSLPDDPAASRGFIRNQSRLCARSHDGSSGRNPSVNPACSFRRHRRSGSGRLDDRWGGVGRVRMAVIPATAGLSA
jgi:hypothetical protein